MWVIKLNHEIEKSHWQLNIPRMLLPAHYTCIGKGSKVCLEGGQAFELEALVSEDLACGIENQIITLTGSLLSLSRSPPIIDGFTSKHFASFGGDK